MKGEILNVPASVEDGVQVVVGVITCTYEVQWQMKMADDGADLNYSPPSTMTRR